MASYRARINAWCLYDWANSAFVTSVVAVLLPIYFRRMAGDDLAAHEATAFWGYVNSGGLLIVALFGPRLGFAADQSRHFKRIFGFFLTAGFLGCMFLSLVPAGNWAGLLVVYLVAAIGFSGGEVFYNAMLPHLARREDVDSVSARGFAFGYLGGGLLLALNVAMLIALDDAAIAYRLSFAAVGVWWLIFSIPLFVAVPAPEARFAPGGYLNFAGTLRSIARNRNLLWFLLAYWIYADGIGTIYRMGVVYAAERGLPARHLILVVLGIQFVSFPFALLWGGLARRYGVKRCITAALGIFLLISVRGFTLDSPAELWTLGAMIAAAQGGTQALSRSLFVRLIPPEQSAEHFGFFAFSSKLSGVLGPLMFGLISHVSGSGRYGILSLSFFFIVGAALLAKVKVPEEKDLK